MATKIAWCDETINPVVGCSKISAGCQNCYAENMAARLASMGLGQYQSVTSFRRWNGLTAFVPAELEKPHGWKKPRTIFVSSMGDLFHKSAQFEWFEQVMRTVMELPRHTFIFLTKRPERMREWLAQYPLTLHNLVIGVSVEDQQAADERIPVLLQIPAAKRFISLEPMIGPVNLRLVYWPAGYGLYKYLDCLTGLEHGGINDKGVFNSARSNGYVLPGLNGVILGGESGCKARPISPLWARQVRDQCAAEGVPFMFKQWSRNVIHAGTTFGFYDHATGRPMLDGVIHSGLPWTVR